MYSRFPQRKKAAEKVFFISFARYRKMPPLRDTLALKYFKTVKFLSPFFSLPF